MGKYEPLGQFLRTQTGERVTMTFTEIERVLGTKLPASKQNRAWWSNNPHNNVMTRAWLAAGYETEQVNVEEGRLVFRRKKPVPRNAGARKPIYGCMKGLVTIMPGVDLTAPLFADDEWNAGEIGGMEKR